jgi:hypothetical protein
VSIREDGETREGRFFRLHTTRLPKKKECDYSHKKKRYHSINESNIRKEISHTEKERFFDHRLDRKCCEIRHEAIGSEEDNGRNKGIDKY